MDKNPPHAFLKGRELSTPNYLHGFLTLTLMKPDFLKTPSALLQDYGIPVASPYLEWEKFCMEEGESISIAIDQLQTPHIKRYNETGKRIDEILYPAEYYRLLYKGYETGFISQVLQEQQLIPFFVLGYITSFFDPGLYCPYTVTLCTAFFLEKYGSSWLKERYLGKFMTREKPWQGATWMTEIKGGSDLGNHTETLAYETNNGTVYLVGEKYFCSNANAESALVVARPHQLKPHVKNLGLYFVPRYNEDGELNWKLERLKNKIGTRSVPTGEISFYKSVAYPLGDIAKGIYFITEVLNLSRVANAIGSVALMQKCLNLVHQFVSTRTSFGKRLIDHLLIQRELESYAQQWLGSFALAWHTAFLLNKNVYKTPPYDEAFQIFRLFAHIAKYYTAEMAIRTARWALTTWAGIGTLQEFPVERLLREALVLAIWEGTPHLHALETVKLLQKTGIHEIAFDTPEIPLGQKKALLQLCNQFLKKSEEEQYRNALSFLHQLGETLAYALQIQYP